MSNTSFFPVPDETAEAAWIDAANYERMYAESIANPERFWAEHGRRIDWIKPFTKVKDGVSDREAVMGGVWEQK